MARVEVFNDPDYTKEPGRPNAKEYRILSPVASFLANKINPDWLTLSGAFFGTVGTYLLSYPKETAQKIEQFTKGSLKLSETAIRAGGAIGVLISYIFDVLDGAVARKSEKGETKHGLVIDGLVNKITDITPSVTSLWKKQDADTLLTQGLFRTLAIGSTMVRSAGIEHDVPIAKTGLFARIGRLPLQWGGLLLEGQRNLIGKALVAQVGFDLRHRYKQIASSGKKEAIRQTRTDLLELFGSRLIAYAISDDPKTRELIAGGLELLKLIEVKTREADAVDKRKKIGRSNSVI